jgi:hypothetical protein
LIGGVILDSISINYLGGNEILIHPLYLKWSQLNIESIQGAAANLKTDLKGVEANMDNLNIIAYLSTLLRCSLLVA